MRIFDKEEVNTMQQSLTIALLVVRENLEKTNLGDLEIKILKQQEKDFKELLNYIN